MEVALIQNGNITKIGDYKDVFADTSFPIGGPSDEWLAENGAKKITRFKSYDALTQKLVQVAAYDDGEFVSVVQVQALTAEEIQSAKDSAMAQLRNTRDNLLKSSDWMVIRSAETSVALASDWATYRQALRDLPANVQDARTFTDWPKDPDYVEMA